MLKAVSIFTLIALTFVVVVSYNFLPSPQPTPPLSRQLATVKPSLTCERALIQQPELLAEQTQSIRIQYPETSRFLGNAEAQVIAEIAAARARGVDDQRIWEALVSAEESCPAP